MKNNKKMIPVVEATKEEKSAIRSRDKILSRKELEKALESRSASNS